MRVVPLAVFLAFFLVYSAHARADTFTFTPTGGTAINFTTGATPDVVNTYYPADYAEYFTNFGRVAFLGADMGVYFDAHYGYGPTPYDLELSIGPTGALVYLLDGPQLFLGTADNPHFISGTYQLVADQLGGNGVGGTLVVNGGVAAVTPEPSSLVLFGTGILAALGLARRRFVTA